MDHAISHLRWKEGEGVELRTVREYGLQRLQGFLAATCGCCVMRVVVAFWYESVQLYATRVAVSVVDSVLEDEHIRRASSIEHHCNAPLR